MVEHKTAVNLPHSEAEAIFQLMLESKGITAQPTEMEKKKFFFFFQYKRLNLPLSKKRTYFVKGDMILFSELARGWKIKFMWSVLHLYSLAIILYNQKGSPAKRSFCA